MQVADASNVLSSISLLSVDGPPLLVDTQQLKMPIIPIFSGIILGDRQSVWFLSDCSCTHKDFQNFKKR